MSKSKPEKEKIKSFTQWWDDVGTKNVELVADAMGSTFGYMRKLRYSKTGTRPSYDFAKRLIEAASSITPGFAPDLIAMLEGERNTEKRHTPGRCIEPSPAFTKAQKKAARQ